MAGGWLRDLVSGYRWLWRAQRRWRPGPRWLAGIEFSGRVIADLLRSILPTPHESTMITHSPVHSLGAVLSTTRVVIASALVVGALAIFGERITNRERQRTVAPQPVIVNGARMRVGEAPLAWAMSGPGLTRESALEVQSAIDSWFTRLTPAAASRFTRGWDLEPWRRFTFRVGSRDLQSGGIVVVSLARPLPQPTHWPTILNPDEVRHAIVQAYPPQLRAEGRGGTVAVQFLVGADGEVQQTRIRQISGYPALDEAAVSVADVYRFSPAVNEGRPVASWATSPISFRVRDGRP